MPKFHVEKSISIDAPVESIYPLVRDLHQWRRWSPWVLAEPDCKLTYSEDGRSYEWDGKLIGSGKLEVIEETEHSAIHFRLHFFKPWKSESTTSIFFEPRNQSVTTRWTMDGSLPFFLFWMKASMTTFIGMDYDRGLRMLKDLAETNAIPSNLEFRGRTKLAPTKCIGFRSTCSLDDIGQKMSQELTRLRELIETNNLKPTGPILSLYHKFKAGSGTFDFSIAVTVEAIPETLPEGLASYEIPESPAYLINHTGPYRHLGNAWAAGMIHARGGVFKHGKQFPPFERYVSDPETTAEREIQTEVYFPIKT